MNLNEFKSLNKMNEFIFKVSFDEKKGNEKL